MKKFAIPAVLAFGLIYAPQAYAGGEIYDPASTCTTANCAAVRLNGTIMSIGPAAGKWVAEVYTYNDECLRLHVTSQFADLETVVVDPNGTVYRDDDGGGNLRPLVKINPTQSEGWYTVSIGHSDGRAESGSFTVYYGTYNLNNPNCATPTPPLGSVTAAAKTASATRGPISGEPGSR